MEGRRRRLRVERQRRDENSATRANATTSQGKREGGAKASVKRWLVDKGKVRARPPQRHFKEKTLAVRGLEELFFQLCCCVSFWFWREIGFGFTYYPLQASAPASFF